MQDISELLFLQSLKNDLLWDLGSGLFGDDR